MTKEEKELLLRDLSARLPYRNKVEISYNKEHGSSDRLRICSEGVLTLNTDLIGLYIEDEIYLKPYLRSLSSMTEEEKLHLKLNYGFELHGNVLSNLHIIKGGGYYEREGEYVEPTEYRQYTHITIDTVSELINWLNAHHFDYRGLIEKGLALEALKGMYK